MFTYDPLENNVRTITDNNIIQSSSRSGIANVSPIYDPSAELSSAIIQGQTGF